MQAVNAPSAPTAQQHASKVKTLARLKTFAAWSGYLFAALVAVGLPLFMVQMNVPFIRLMDEIYHPIVLLQLFVFSASLVLTMVVASKLWQQRKGTLQATLPVVLGALVAFHYLALMRQHAARSWDYRCYEEAAQAIVNGLNPYGSCYIYFPTPAQALAAMAQSGGWLIATLGIRALESSSGVWDLLFYFYEATQLLLVILAFTLCYRLAKLVGLSWRNAALLVTALFLINNPLLATLKHNQVNLWVLDLLLLALLGVQHYPILSGIAVALGAHIKLYPLALLLPWTLQRQWRALTAVTVGMTTIFLLQTSGGRDLTLWQQFLAFAGSFPQGTFFRDNSLHSFVYNSLGMVKWLLHAGGIVPGTAGDFAVNEFYVRLLVLGGMALLGLIYLWRFVKRERLAATLAHSNGQFDHALLGHTMDAIALALIASPVVWEHHYLLAMPLVIWAVARARSERELWLIGVSTFLIFVLPTFDLYPLSYHRLAGLLLLMAVMRPTGATISKGEWSLPWHWFGSLAGSEAESSLEIATVSQPANVEQLWEQRT